MINHDEATRVAEVFIGEGGEYFSDYKLARAYLELKAENGALREHLDRLSVAWAELYGKLNCAKDTLKKIGNVSYSCNATAEALACLDRIKDDKI